jgi:hypothetical protein
VAGAAGRPLSQAGARAFGAVAGKAVPDVTAGRIHEVPVVRRGRADAAWTTERPPALSAGVREPRDVRACDRHPQAMQKQSFGFRSPPTRLLLFRIAARASIV